MEGVVLDGGVLRADHRDRRVRVLPFARTVTGVGLRNGGLSS